MTLLPNNQLVMDSDLISQVRADGTGWRGEFGEQALAGQQSISGPLA